MAGRQGQGASGTCRSRIRNKVIAAFREFAKKKTPKGIRTEAPVLSASPGLVVNPDHPAIQIAAQAFRDILQQGTSPTTWGFRPS